jgi:hypothetical protein
MSFVASSLQCVSLASALTVALSLPFSLAEPNVWNFDKDKIGALPSEWLSELTGQGIKGTWKVLTDRTAPSKPNILAQTSTDIARYRFPLVVIQNVRHKNVVLSVQFKVISGKRDQTAGLVWRYRDANNYYAARANVLEGKVILYKVEEGKIRHLNPNHAADPKYDVNVSMRGNAWQELSVKVSGSLFLVSLNDQALFEVEDDTFGEAGKVGLCTKADSVTHFDNFTVRESTFASKR